VTAKRRCSLSAGPLGAEREPAGQGAAHCASFAERMRLTRRAGARGYDASQSSSANGKSPRLSGAKGFPPTTAQTSPPYAQASTAFSTTIWGDTRPREGLVTRNLMEGLRLRAPLHRAVPGDVRLCFARGASCQPIVFAAGHIGALHAARD
jgi:hypothetical protein